MGKGQEVLLRWEVSLDSGSVEVCDQCLDTSYRGLGRAFWAEGKCLKVLWKGKGREPCLK